MRIGKPGIKEKSIRRFAMDQSSNILLNRINRYMEDHRYIPMRSNDKISTILITAIHDRQTQKEEVKSHKMTRSIYQSIPILLKIQLSTEKKTEKNHEMTRSIRQSIPILFKIQLSINFHDRQTQKGELKNEMKHSLTPNETKLEYSSPKSSYL